MSETQQGTAGFTADARPAPAADAPAVTPPRTSRWRGWVMFAGIMMILIGAFQAIAGLASLFRDTYYLVTSGGLLVSVDYTTWGWIHLALGTVVILAGLAVMRGSTWGRVVGVLLAAVSAIANLLFLAAYPVWSILVIAMDVLVIWALVVHGDEVEA